MPSPRAVPIRAGRIIAVAVIDGTAIPAAVPIVPVTMPRMIKLCIGRRGGTQQGKRGESREKKFLHDVFLS
jgi:hypothetical protein